MSLCSRRGNLCSPSRRHESCHEALGKGTAACEGVSKGMPSGSGIPLTRLEAIIWRPLQQLRAQRSLVWVPLQEPLPVSWFLVVPSEHQTHERSSSKFGPLTWHTLQSRHALPDLALRHVLRAQGYVLFQESGSGAQLP